MKEEVVNSALKAMPPATVSVVATAQSWALADYVALATLIYLCLQGAHLLWHWFREVKPNRKGRR